MVLNYNAIKVTKENYLDFVKSIKAHDKTITWASGDEPTEWNPFKELSCEGADVEELYIFNALGNKLLFCEIDEVDYDVTFEYTNVTTQVYNVGDEIVMEGVHLKIKKYNVIKLKEEQFEDFAKQAYALELRWTCGEKPSEFNPFEVDSDFQNGETVGVAIRNGAIGYDCLDYFETVGAQFINFEDLEKLEIKENHFNIEGGK